MQNIDQNLQPLKAIRDFKGNYEAITANYEEDWRYNNVRQATTRYAVQRETIY